MTFIIPGTKYDLHISFPLREKIFIRAVLMDRDRILPIETWEKPIAPRIWNQYGMWIPIVEKYIERFLQDR